MILELLTDEKWGVVNDPKRSTASGTAFCMVVNTLRVILVTPDSIQKMEN